MLARSAQGLYWMGRHIERAEHLCRLLRLQIETLVDRPLREIHHGWRRIYLSLGRRPPPDGREFEPHTDDDLTLADAYALADDLTFEKSHQSSIWSCFANGRENARQIRNCISEEMWTCMNLMYLHLKGLRIEDIWRPSPENFYAETARGIDTFTGVARTTMYRDRSWWFMQLGRFIERAQLTSSLLRAQLTLQSVKQEELPADWLSLLRLYQALDTYKRHYSTKIESAKVLLLVAGDDKLPYSLAHSLTSINNELQVIAGNSDDCLVRESSRLLRVIDEQQYSIGVFEKIYQQLLTIHRTIIDTYIDYEIDDSPVANVS